MSKEVYVSFETAKHLKEKGFDWECSTYLYTINVYNYGDEPCRFQINNSKNSELASDKMTVPTQQMACDWLTEEKNIYVTAVPDIGNSLRFYPAIYIIRGEIPDEYWFEHINSIVEELNKSYGKPQQAVEAALEYVLTYLI